MVWSGSCGCRGKVWWSLKSSVSCILTRLLSRDSQWKSSGIFVTLLAFRYLLVAYLRHVAEPFQFSSLLGRCKDSIPKHSIPGLAWQVCSRLRFWSPCCWPWGFSGENQPYCFLSSQSCQYAGSRRCLMKCQRRNTLIVSLSQVCGPPGCSRRGLVIVPLLRCTYQGETAYPKSLPMLPVSSGLPIVGDNLVVTWQPGEKCLMWQFQAGRL